MPQRIHFIDIPPPDVLWLCVGQKALPQVSAGGHAHAGQVVGGVEQTSSLAVTPLDGTVGQARDTLDSRGVKQAAVSVLIDDDAELRPPPMGEPFPLGALTRADMAVWIDRLERAGVRSDRHNSPPLYRQLHEAMRRPIDTVICHCLEADPQLPLQIQWALRHPEDLRDGLRLLSRLAGARRSLLVAPDADHRRLARIYRRLHPSRRPRQNREKPLPDGARGEVTDLSPAAFEPLGIRLLSLPNTYPQADPSLLIWTLLSRRLSPGHLPPEAGVVCVDAVTAVAIGAVARGLKVIGREPVAIRDHRPGREIAVLADVWRGTRLGDALHALTLISARDATRPAVRAGDFLRHHEMPEDVVLDGGELVFHLTDPAPTPMIDPCIRCGWCLEICPTGVHPAGVLEAAQRQDTAMGSQFGMHACINCGLCNYVCPSNLPLVEAVEVCRKFEKKP